jgi:hypothetical protein
LLVRPNNNLSIPVCAHKNSIAVVNALHALVTVR